MKNYTSQGFHTSLNPSQADAGSLKPELKLSGLISEPCTQRIITPCKNAFNEKTSWWLSKRDYTIAMYAFTADTEREVEYQMEHIDSYINNFELLLNRH